MQTKYEREKIKKKKKQPKPSDNFIVFYDETQLLHLHIYC